MKRVLYVKPLTLLKKVGNGVKKMAAWYAAAWSLLGLIVVASSVLTNYYGFNAKLVSAVSASRTVFSNHPSIETVSLQVPEAKAGEDDVKKQVYSEIKQDLQEKYITDLGPGCESKGVKEPEALVTFDPDKTGKIERVPSFGPYQFKVPTVQHYYKLLYKKTITQREAIEIALDPVKSKELARDVAFRGGTGASEWVTCFKRVDMQTKINLVNQLPK